MIRILCLSACLVSLVVWDAAAQQLVPKPSQRSGSGFGAIAWAVRPGLFTHDRAVEGWRRAASSACRGPSRLSVVDNS